MNNFSTKLITKQGAIYRDNNYKLILNWDFNNMTHYNHIILKSIYHQEDE